MATNVELFSLKSSEVLINRIEAEVYQKAAALLNLAPPSASQISWVDKVLDNPRKEANRLLLYLLGDQADNDLSLVISNPETNPSDAVIATRVSAAVDQFITGGV